MAKFFKSTLLTKGLILVSIPLLFELTFGITMFCLQSYYRQIIAQESKAKAIIYHANEMWLNTTDACVERIENSIFGTVHNQREEEQNIKKEYEALRVLVADEPIRLRYLKKLQIISIKLLNTGQEFQNTEQNQNQMLEDGGMASLTGKVSSFKQLQAQLKQFGRLIRVFREPDELKSQDAEKKVAQVQTLIELVIIGAVILSVLMNGFLLLYFMKGINRGLLSLLENTKRMARSEPLLPELKTEDEFGFLDRSFHAMSKAVESATRRERATINNAGDMIYVLAEDRSLLSCNPAVSNKLAYEQKELKENGLENLILPADVEKLLAALARASSTGRSETLELRMCKQDGSMLWTSWTLQWSKEDREYFCIAHDVTEMKNMQQMKQEFFGMISHDMRTPLTSMVAAVDGLLAGIAGEISDKGKQYLKLAEQNGQYLLSLVQDILDIERLSAGAFPLKPENFDLFEIFRHAAEMVSPLVQANELSLDVPAGNLSCQADRDALTRVIVNLLSNAIKFSPKGASIEIKASKDAETFKVEIRDHGRGIPESELANVFDRFKQVSIDDRKKKGGSGLGLAICKGFVEAHGGQIGVKSKPGEGTTFWFAIPHLADSSA